MKIGYLAAILKQIFYIFFPEIWLLLVYIHWCKDNLKIPVGKWFSRGGGVPWNPPLCTNGIKCGVPYAVNIHLLKTLRG